MKYKPEQIDIKRLRRDLLEKIRPLIELEEEEEKSSFLINPRLDLDYAIAYGGLPEKVMEIAYRYDIDIEDYLL